MAQRSLLIIPRDKLTDIPDWPAPEFLKNPWPTVPSSNSENRTMSGPLMTTVLAMFGERSFLASVNDSRLAVSQICQSGRMPFITFSGYERYANECSITDGDDIDQASRALSSIMAKF